MADGKVAHDANYIPQKRGNGILRREIWVDANGKVTRYNLAYINPAIHAGDNGRVVGYDNAHNYHHRHYLGAVEDVEFVTFEEIEDLPMQANPFPMKRSSVLVTRRTCSRCSPPRAWNWLGKSRRRPIR